jgi:hypothetical protein
MGLFNRTPKDRTDEILRRHIDADFYLVAAHESAPSKRELESLGKKLGCSFPGDFVAHSTGPLAGVYIEVKEELWPRPKEYDVGPFWTFLYAMFVYGASPEIPEWMNLELAADKFRENTGHPYVPCLKVVGDANVYCFEPGGAIVQWDHETDEFEKYSGGFFDLLESEVSELRGRKNKKVARAT